MIDLDKRLLINTYKQIDEVEHELIELQSNELKNTEAIKQTINRLQQLKNQADAILTMIS
jgi:uncharacterized protein Yka (UPF0111/DUF47 family)